MSSSEWRQPGRLTKNRDPHRLFLHPLALDILKSRWAAWAHVSGRGGESEATRLTGEKLPMSGLVFPAPRSGRPIDTFTDIKAAMVSGTETANDERPLDGWTWHDFRRSFASALGEAGIPEAVADAVLNHKQSATRGGVLGVYQRSSRWPEQVKAMQLWGRLLEAAIHGADDNATVVPMVPRSG
jgi:integrase